MNTHAPWYRQFWPWFLMLPPAVALTGGLATLWLAVEHADSVVPDRLSRVGVAVQPDYAAGATAAGGGGRGRPAYFSAEDFAHVYDTFSLLRCVQGSQPSFCIRPTTMPAATPISLAMA